MTDYIEIACRWIFGLQMFFWGLNGFFHWVKNPPSDPAIDRFVQACIETRFIMPTVKIFEVIGGALLVMHMGVPLTLALLAPIIFVVTGLHIAHNPKPWGVLITTTLPYGALLIYHSATLLRLIH